MNTRGGWALIRNSWASWLQYRSFFFLLAFGWMIPPLIYLFVWSTAAASPASGSEPLGPNSGGMAGMSAAEFAGYYLILILVNQITYAQTNWTLGDIIRSGGLNAWLLRPMAPLYNVLASEAAGKVVYMAFVGPVAALLAVLLHPELHPTPAGASAFLPALLLAWALRFAWGYALALLAFWAARADALLALQDTLVFLLGGIVAPIALLPPALRTAATWLPFRYMLGFPVETLSGRLDTAALLSGLACQVGWLAVAAAAAMIAWRAGIRRYTALGG